MAGIRTESPHISALDGPDYARSAGHPGDGGVVISQKPAKTRPRVLVVADERLVRWSLSEMLTTARYQVVEAENGRQARVAMADEEHPVDVMVVDAKLPDADGLLLVREARRRCVTCPVFFMTADGFADGLGSDLRAGVDHVMVKPFDLDDFLRLVRQVCPAA